MLGTRPLRTGAWMTQRKMLLPHVCYHTKFRRSRSNRLGVGRGPKNLGDAGSLTPLDEEVSDLQKYASAHLLLCQIRSF